METRLRPWLASAGVAVLAMVSIPGIPFAAQAASAESDGTGVTAPEDPGHGSMMRDAGHGDMMRSMSSMGPGHDAAGCMRMMVADGHDNHMTANGHAQMMSAGSGHGMS